MKRQNEKAPIIKPRSRVAMVPSDKSRCSDHPAHTGTPPNLGGEEVTPKADGTDQENNLLTL